MQFYKLQGELTMGTAGEGEKKIRKELAHRIAARTAEFNGMNPTRFCFLSDVSGDCATFGLIVTEYMDLVRFAQDYVKGAGLQVQLSFPDEITFGSMQNLLSNACRQNYLEDDDEILERFGLDRICGRSGRDLDFGENLVNDMAEQKDLFTRAERYFMNETLVPELERIYAGGKSLCVKGHPVHYIVEVDDHDTRRETYRILLDALYANRRLHSSRYAFLDFHPGESYSRIAYDALYRVSEYGAIVVRYLAENGEEEASTASGERATIENLCEMAKKYRNKVLTVFCFPRECKKVKAMFYENLGSLSFVEIREDFIGAEAAGAYLTRMAKEHRIRVDKRLLAGLAEDRSYSADELQRIFDEWYDSKLKSTVYPQYKSVTAVRKEAVAAKPRGSAYDELMEMIGLTEAKGVIAKALNYYKMQKLYEEKGVKRDNPAMHMIFSGNPGTAKTTVARLFARIMQENGLLSRGQLVEVGRADLVGKFVGWTAPLVKEKFKAASGGVLFIDEAYALATDNGGSFGDEAIHTIVQEMENHRADVVVIFAGYPDKMETFLQRNPGLRSRIAFHVPFADYNNEELCRIAELISRKNGMQIQKDAVQKMEKVFSVARADSDFGNGRYVRNLFEQAKMNQASRLLAKDFDSITEDEITTITAEDIVIPPVKKPEKRRIGFC